MTTSTARHAWLEKATVQLRKLFIAKGYTVPTNVRVSIGWPRGSHGKARAIGQCWGVTSSHDKFNEVFISPELGHFGARSTEESTRAISVKIIGVLAHELAHAAVGVAASHGSVFKRCATAIGLTGKMTATEEGPEFVEWANKLIKKLGGYPSGGLIHNSGTKQTTRMIKCSCHHCGYTARVSRKWIAEAGAPVCPTDEVEMRVAK